MRKEEVDQTHWSRDEWGVREKEKRSRDKREKKNEKNGDQQRQEREKINKIIINELQ